jgi:hypothetical protein
MRQVTTPATHVLEPAAASVTSGFLEPRRPAALTSGPRDVVSDPNEDVVAHGQAIFGRLKAGTMPCVGAWLADQVALFKRRLAQGGNE